MSHPARIGACAHVLIQIQIQIPIAVELRIAGLTAETAHSSA